MDLPTRLFFGDGELRYPEADNKNPNHDENDEHPIASQDSCFGISIFLGYHINQEQPHQKSDHNEKYPKLQLTYQPRGGIYNFFAP